jgi:hypothetical protein
MTKGLGANIKVSKDLYGESEQEYVRCMVNSPHVNIKKQNQLGPTLLVGPNFKPPQ